MDCRPQMESPHECEPICDHCVECAERDIRLLPLDYFDLMRDLQRKAGASDVKIARPHPASSTPVDTNVDGLAREIHWALTCWEPALREAAGLSPEVVRNVRPGWAVANAVAVIAPRVAQLAALPLTACYADGLDGGPVERDGRDAIAQLRRLHRRARAILGITQLVFRLPGECSNGCTGWTLRRKAGADTVWCVACERRWTYEDYRRYVNLTLEDIGRGP